MLHSRATLLGMFIPFLLLSTSLNAAPITVYVGYADSLRPSGFFPTPFDGAPGVIYSGISPTVAALDSGAVRIDNTGTTPVTISDLTVTLNPGTGPTVFSLWAAPVTLAPGQKGIYAQTASSDNFDTSDYGFLGAVGIDAAHPLGGCTNPGALTTAQQHECIINQPVVTFMANGQMKSYTDSGTVLNTFGYDFINGSSDGNESINWNLIGATPNRSGTPEPSTFLLLGSGLLCGVAAFRLRKKS